MLALIGGWGFYQGYELAQAIFMLAAPLMLTSVFSVRLAYRIKNEVLEGEALRKALRKRRIWNQTIGIIAIILAAAATIYHFLAVNDFFVVSPTFYPRFQ